MLTGLVGQESSLNSQCCHAWLNSQAVMFFPFCTACRLMLHCTVLYSTVPKTAVLCTAVLYCTAIWLLRRVWHILSLEGLPVGSTRLPLQAEEVSVGAGMDDVVQVISFAKSPQAGELDSSELFELVMVNLFQEKLSSMDRSKAPGQMRRMFYAGLSVSCRGEDQRW